MWYFYDILEHRSDWEALTLKIIPQGIWAAQHPSVHHLPRSNIFLQHPRFWTLPLPLPLQAKHTSPVPPPFRALFLRAKKSNLLVHEQKCVWSSQTLVGTLPMILTRRRGFTDGTVRPCGMSVGAASLMLFPLPWNSSRYCQVDYLCLPKWSGLPNMAWVILTRL